MEKCSICCDDVYPVNFKLSCGHMFHKHCIKKWNNINKTCPICREIQQDNYLCISYRKPCFVRLFEPYVFLKIYTLKPISYYLSNLKSIYVRGRKAKLKFHINNKNIYITLKCESKIISNQLKKSIIAKKYNNEYENVVAQNIHNRRALLN